MATKIFFLAMVCCFFSINVFAATLEESPVCGLAHGGKFSSTAELSGEENQLCAIGYEDDLVAEAVTFTWVCRSLDEQKKADCQATKADVFVELKTDTGYPPPCAQQNPRIVIQNLAVGGEKVFPLEYDENACQQDYLIAFRGDWKNGAAIIEHRNLVGGVGHLVLKYEGEEYKIFPLQLMREHVLDNRCAKIIESEPENPAFVGENLIVEEQSADVWRVAYGSHGMCKSEEKIGRQTEYVIWEIVKGGLQKKRSFIVNN